MGNSVKKNVKSKKDWNTILNERFDYLSPKEREELIDGDKFVKVPNRELTRLRIDVYPYLIK